MVVGQAETLVRAWEVRQTLYIHTYIHIKRTASRCDVYSLHVYIILIEFQVFWASYEKAYNEHRQGFNKVFEQLSRAVTKAQQITLKTHQQKRLYLGTLKGSPDQNSLASASPSTQGATVSAADASQSGPEATSDSGNTAGSESESTSLTVGTQGLQWAQVLDEFERETELEKLFWQVRLHLDHT